jgi:hypothetical protein
MYLFLYLLNNLGMATHRLEGLSGSTKFFEETFGTFPHFFEMIPKKGKNGIFSINGGYPEKRKVSKLLAAC